MDWGHVLHPPTTTNKRGKTRPETEGQFSIGCDVYREVRSPNDLWLPTLRAGSTAE